MKIKDLAKSPVPMRRDIRNIWYLAMHSPDYQRITGDFYTKTKTVLHSADGGFSAVGILCDLYAQASCEEHWVLTGLAYEWDGIYLGEAPDEVIIWAFDIKNLGYAVDVEKELVRALRTVLFNFDMYIDSQKDFPHEGLIRKIFG